MKSTTLYGSYDYMHSYKSISFCMDKNYPYSLLIPPFLAPSVPSSMALMLNHLSTSPSLL